MFALSVLHAEDSTKTFVGKEVVVFGERIQTKERLLPSSVTVLSSMELHLQSGTSVASALKNIPSVFLRGYGGNGSLQILSLRGMSGEHTAVLVDGEPFSNVQNGLVDVGIFLTDDVERIELAKGGYSSLIGSNAVGGVLNIVTKKPTDNVHASFSSSVGSFGFQSNAVSLSGGTDVLRFKGSFSAERARNDYDFPYSDGSQNYTLKRSGADYSMKNAGVQLTAEIRETIEASVSARYSLADRGTPSGVSSPFQNNRARLNDDNLFLTSSLRWQFSPQTVISIAPHLHYFLQHYTDPTYNTKSFSLSRVGGFSATLQRNFSEQDKFRGALEGVFADVRGSNLIAHTRVNGALSFSSEHHPFDAEDFVFFPSFRIDSYEDLPLSFSPKIGANVQVLKLPELRLRASIGKNFRAPTFNELYYQPGGNPNLRPEKSLSADAGFLLFVDDLGHWKLESNYFLIDTRDRIVWTPCAGSMWSPMNVYRVVSTGMEIAIEHSLMDDMLQWNASYSYMEVVRKDAAGAASQTHNKQLIYTPYELASLSLRGTVSAVTVSLRHSFTGFRYIQENNDPRYILSEFQTTDVVALAKIPVEEHVVIIKADAQNIFNSHYQWIPSYPVPGRSFALTISLHY